jgi:hypothetical protein
MKGLLRASVLLTTIFAIAGCAVEGQEADQGGRATAMATDSAALTAAEAYGGLTYGAGVVRSRGGGSVKACIAGPMGVLLPNRFVSCYCDQLVKDCAQDTTCTTCTTPRYEQCSSTRWFSSVSYLFGDCNVSELDACAAYCQQSCSSSCAME